MTQKQYEAAMIELESDQMDYYLLAFHFDTIEEHY